MANVTLSIDDELITRGRSYAKARGTNLNSLVRKLLVEAVSNPDSSVETTVARLRQSAGDSKGVKTPRAELHRH